MGANIRGSDIGIQENISSVIGHRDAPVVMMSLATMETYWERKHVRHHGYWFVCFCMNTNIYNLRRDRDISIVSIVTMSRRLGSTSHKTHLDGESPFGGEGRRCNGEGGCSPLPTVA